MDLAASQLVIYSARSYSIAEGKLYSAKSLENLEMLMYWGCILSSKKVLETTGMVALGDLCRSSIGVVCSSFGGLGLRHVIRGRRGERCPSEDSSLKSGLAIFAMVLLFHALL